MALSARSRLTWYVAAYSLASVFLGRAYTVVGQGTASMDAELFAYIGREMQNGKILYRDVWDHKPPGIFIVDALASARHMNVFSSVALLEVVAFLALVFVACKVAKELGANAGLMACIVAAGTNISFYNEGGNLTETFLLLPELLSVYFVIRHILYRTKSSAIAAGLFAGLACMFKPVGLAPFLAAMLWVFMLCILGRRTLQWAFTTTMLLFSGVVLAWLPTMLYFAFKNQFSELMFASFTYNFHYAQYGLKGLHKLQPLTLLEPVLGLGVGAAIFAALYAGVLYRTQYQSRGTVCHTQGRPEGPARLALVGGFLILWLLGDVGGALAGANYYPHYFLPVISSLAICASLAFGELLSSTVFKRALLALIFAPLVLIQVQDLIHLRHARVGQDWHMVALDIRKEAKPTDTLFCWDYCPGVYFETELSSPTRHLFASRFKFNREHATEVLSALTNRPASYVVIRKGDALAPEFGALLQERYSLWTTDADLQIYKLNVRAPVQ